MGDIDGQRALSPKYDDPAFIGGNFIVDLMKGNPVFTTGENPVVNPDEIERMRVVQAAQVSDSAPSVASDKARRAELRTGLRAIGQTLVDIIRTSSGGSTQDWTKFWHDNIALYGAAWMTIHRMSEELNALGVIEAMTTIRDDEFHARLASKFPEAARELDFLTSVVDSAAEMASTFEPVSDEKRAQDFEIVARFHHWGAHFSMCMLTLDLCADGLVQLSREMCEHVLSTARKAATEFNHATTQAAELREPEPRTRTCEIGDESERIGIDDDLEVAEESIQKWEEAAGKVTGD